MARALKALGYFREEPVRRSSNARPEAPAQPSLAEQNRTFFEFIRREGYEVAATFVESGDETGHPELQRLLDYLKRRPDGQYVVIVSSLDHLGRDRTQAAQWYFQMDGLGARLISLGGEADPLATLLDHWGERSSHAQVGERVREAMRRKAVRGEALGRPPYGYRVGNNRRLEPVADEATLVRYIFRLYTREGLGIRLIARRLNEEGYRTRRDGNWSMVTIRDILLNRAYLGTYTRFGVRVPGSHAALISPEEYRRVQDRMASRRTSGGPRNVRHFLLSGLAYCGYCGNHMIGVSRKQTWKRQGDGSQGEAEYRYYQCLSRTNQSMCDYHTRRADDLETEVRDQAALAMEQALASADGLDSAAQHGGEELDRLRGRLKQLDRQLEGYMQQAASHELSLEQLREFGVGVTQRQMETVDAITELEGRRLIAETLGEQRRARSEALFGLREGWEQKDFEGRQRLLKDVVERVTVLDEGALVRLHA